MRCEACKAEGILQITVGSKDRGRVVIVRGEIPWDEYKGKGCVCDRKNAEYGEG